MTSDASKSIVSQSEPAPPRVQFGLQTLLALPVVVAVSLVLLKQFHIFGLLTIFVAALLLQFAPVGGRKSPARRLAVDLAWGVVMPILCLAYDPMFFRETGDRGIFGYCIVGTEMVVLLAWLPLGHRSRWLAGLFCGALAAGTLTAATVGVILLPISLIGLVVGIGVLGLTPWMTAGVFWRNTRAAYATWSRKSNAGAPFLIVLGFVLALAVSQGLYFLLGDALSTWVQSIAWPDGFP